MSSISGSGKIPWRRAWQPTPVFLENSWRIPRTEEPGRVHRVSKSRTWLKWLSTHASNPRHPWVPCLGARILPCRKQEPLASFHFPFQAREEPLGWSLRDISTPLIGGSLHEKISWGLTAQLVKNSPAMWETPVWFLGWEDPLEKG